MELLNREISCPYCGESIEVLIDDSVSENDYFEDCSVCCRPIRILLSSGFEGDCQMAVLRDDD